MTEHPIQGLMKTAMESIREMVDVNTIVGDAVKTPDGAVIVPISRVAFGFAAGGGGGETEPQPDLGRGGGFGGGSGAGVSVKPVGFLVCSPEHGVRFMHVEGNSMYERLLDFVPQAMEKIQEMLRDKEDGAEDAPAAYVAQEASSAPEEAVGK